jgi:hypothetical protein
MNRRIHRQCRPDEGTDQRTDACIDNAAYKSTNDCAYTFSHESSDFPTDERTNDSAYESMRKVPTNSPTKEPTKVENADGSSHEGSYQSAYERVLLGCFQHQRFDGRDDLRAIE